MTTHKRLATILTIWVLAVSSARAQWTEPVRISEPGGGYYPQILAHGDTLHIVFMHWTGGRGIGYIRSTDAGITWNTERELTDTLNTEAPQFPRIISYGNNLLALWKAYFVQGVNRYNIGYSISSNNGLTWSQPSYTLNPNWDHILYFSASGSGPVVNVMLSSRINHELIFFNIRSTNFGQSWFEPDELFRAAQEIWPDQATANSLVHFIWSGRYTFDEKNEIYYMRSTDAGITWSQSVSLSDSDQHHSQLPAINADNFGNVAATWMDFKYSPPGATGDIFLRQSTDSGSFWTAENRLTFNHYAFGSDIVLDLDTIYVVWEDESQGITRRNIYYMRSTDKGASWGEPYWVDGTYDDSWNPAIASSNSRVYAVWYDDRHYPDTIGLYFSRYHYQTYIVGNEIITPTLDLLYAYPNPFNSRAIISLNMIDRGEVELAIYDVRGRLVKTIIKGGNLEKGTHNFTWDATDAFGKKVSSGSYFAVAGTPQGKFKKTLTLIR